MMRTGQIAALVTVAVIATACSAGQLVPPTTDAGFPPTTSAAPIPAVVTSATPSGWVPVAYGDAQVSVPALFSVAYGDEDPCGSYSAPGTLFVAPVFDTNIPCPPTLSIMDGTAVYLVDYGKLPLSTLSEKPRFVNGIEVYETSGGVYAPTLGVEATATGPLARRLLGTLTRSPRAVVLAHGAIPSVGSGWHSVTFDSLAFDAPNAWPVTPTAVAGQGVGEVCGNIGVTFTTTAVVLSTDRQSFPVTACIIRLRSSLHPPSYGIEVDGGTASQFPKPLAFSTHCLDIHGLTACPATNPDYSILVLKVTLPGRISPVLVSIGLAGNGMVARTILNSLRAA